MATDAPIADHIDLDAGARTSGRRTNRSGAKTVIKPFRIDIPRPT
ncbi:hypothetical protein SAMN05216215_100754 [Saccharopolyspora shandongensis]|uniref:Uncharacterized protein n=2 Tax=Saccharopolyspora shandongensis TaxID=418495 RepID=A0A1H2YIT9_9PSEU|nr:hypothetical protein SAMN05216215_100754 [Saccharopolyspora shandongensis]